jgi:hypothetical protein
MAPCLLAGIALAQLVAELAWRFGLAFVPMRPPRLSATTNDASQLEVRPLAGV